MRRMVVWVALGVPSPKAAPLEAVRWPERRLTPQRLIRWLVGQALAGGPELHIVTASEVLARGAKVLHARRKASVEFRQRTEHGWIAMPLDDQGCLTAPWGGPDESFFGHAASVAKDIAEILAVWDA